MQFTGLALGVALLWAADAEAQQHTWISVTSQIDRDKDNSLANRYGLTRDDLRRMRLFRQAADVVPVRMFEAGVHRHAYPVKFRIVGTVPGMLTLPGAKVVKGRFLIESDLQQRQNVCVLTEDVAESLFELADPVGKHIRINQQVFTVVGVVRVKRQAEAAIARASDVYVPLSTMQSRFGDLVIHLKSGSFSVTNFELSEVWLRATRSERELQDAVSGLVRGSGREAELKIQNWRPKSE